jgi:hypothetical protein
VQSVAIVQVSKKPIAAERLAYFVYSGGQWQFSNAGQRHHFREWLPMIDRSRVRFSTFNEG